MKFFRRGIHWQPTETLPRTKHGKALSLGWKTNLKRHREQRFWEAFRPVLVKRRKEKVDKYRLMPDWGDCCIYTKNSNSSYQKTVTASYTFSKNSQNIGYAKPMNCIAKRRGKRKTEILVASIQSPWAPGLNSYKLFEACARLRETS